MFDENDSNGISDSIVCMLKAPQSIQRERERELEVPLKTLYAPRLMFIEIGKSL